MAFRIVSGVVNGVKGGVTAALSGAADVGSTTVNAVKDVTVTTLKETGEFVSQGIRACYSVSKHGCKSGNRSCQFTGKKLSNDSVIIANYQ